MISTSCSGALITRKNERLGTYSGSALRCACSAATISSPVGRIHDTYSACTTRMVTMSANSVTKNSLGYLTWRAERGAGAAAVTMRAVLSSEREADIDTSNIDGERHVEVGAHLLRRREAVGRPLGILGFRRLGLFLGHL